MKKRMQNQEYRIGTGASSLLMILVVLCLTTLGVLSVTGAGADLKLSRRNAEMVSAYYAAEALYQEVLAEINAAIIKTPVGNFEFDTKIDQSLENCDLERDEDGRLTLRFDAGNDRVLEAELEAYGGLDGLGRTRVLRHELLNAREFAGADEEYLNLIA